MKRDAFSQCHPAVNFLYFVGAIGLCVAIQHPAYMIAATIGAASYYLLLNGRNGLKMLLTMLPMFVLISAVNPVFNTYGETVLFYLFSRPYTWEALVYGMVIGGMFVAMMLWFGCYNAVLTSDKFTSLFGNLIPALSLLLVMLLRMIPNLMRKAKQIIGARKSIGKGAAESAGSKEQVRQSMVVLSALTDWALEGSVVTADSMRSRGYGSTKRTSFQIYRLTVWDLGLLALILLLAAATIFGGGKTATFTPIFYVAPLTWGFGAYCAYLLIPTALHIKEAIQWHILRSRI